MDGSQSAVMTRRILSRPRPWDKPIKKKRSPRRSAVPTTRNPDDDNDNDVALLLPTVATVMSCSVDAGQLFALGEVLYVLRPAVYSLLRVRYFTRRSQLSQRNTDTEQKRDNMPPGKFGSGSRRAEKILLIALTVSLVSFYSFYLAFSISIAPVSIVIISLFSFPRNI